MSAADDRPMNAGPTNAGPIDVGALPRLHSGREAPVWWGVAGLVVIAAMVAASFLASYFYLRLYHAVWPPAGVAPPDLLWPGVDLLLLLSSGVALWLAGRALGREHGGWFVFGMFVSAILAALVLLSRWRQYEVFGFRWDSHPYGSIVWTVLGFHGVLVMTAVVWIAAVALLGLRGYITPRRRIAFSIAALYGYFVGLVWIPLYLVLYWAPRWL